MRNWRAITIYSDKFLDAMSWFVDIQGMSIFPFIILRKKYRDDLLYQSKGKETINHENIHFQQSLELFIIPFYIIYIIEWFFKIFFSKGNPYKNISFEREAYGNDSNLDYLKTRKRYNWIKLIFNGQ